MRFVLVHSPLVGPSTWRWVADALEAIGHDAVVPDLTDAASTGDPLAVVEVARRSLAAGPCVVVAHSGAGPLLPSIATGAELGTRRLLFVDAGMPPCDGVTTPAADFLDRLRDLAVDAVLPKWSTWWGDGAMERLVADPDRRAAVETELPEIPLTFYETSIVVPGGWCEGGAGYLLLSEPYREEATTAARRGWPVVERLGSHLDIVNSPETIAGDLVALV